MAWTVTKTPTVFGNKRAVIMKCVADAATQNIETGLSTIEAFSVGYSSMASAAPKLFPNSGLAGTAIAGTLGATGFTTGDELYITVYGR
jgi:hypothetical protein